MNECKRKESIVDEVFFVICDCEIDGNPREIVDCVKLRCMILECQFFIFIPVLWGAKFHAFVSVSLPHRIRPLRCLV